MLGKETNATSGVTKKVVVAGIVVSSIICIFYTQHFYLDLVKQNLISIGVTRNFSSSITTIGNKITEISHKQKEERTEEIGNLKPNITAVDAKTVAVATAIIAPKDLKMPLTKYPFFRSFLVSFCKTATVTYNYVFYLAFDYNDPLYKQESFRQKFEEQAKTITEKQCATHKYKFRWVNCPHSRKPAWAQNDAVYAAYLDNIHYFYRINDDTVFQSAGWPDAFISALSSFNPPNVGVVGPRHHHGNEVDMTYDFTHKTHLDLFGFHYPRLFTDWWADVWITRVYQPGRSLKIRRIELDHTMDVGTRYKVGINYRDQMTAIMNKDKLIIKRYITAKQRGFSPADATLVIAMGLSGNAPRYTYGAVRNAQLMPLIYPGWTLRVYFDASVPLPVRGKLQDLGAQLVEVKDASTPARLWPLRALEDRTLREVLVRDAHARINEREAAAVREWRASNFSVHTMRDTPAHAQLPLVRGLMAARPATLPAVHQLLQDSPSDAEVAKRLTQLFGNSLLAHDSVTCRSDAKPFPLKKTDPVHSVGLHYDAYEVPVSAELKTIRSTSSLVCSRPANHSVTQ